MEQLGGEAIGRFLVRKVAHALEKYKTLNGDDVIAVIEGTEGPIVDGRAYHSPSAEQLLEQYHAIAATAHREHAPVEAHLPELTNGHRPVAVAATPPPPD